MKESVVRMKSFLGTTIADTDVERRENYWQLIGKRGKVITANRNSDNKVLVLFEDDLNDYGLENHNPVKNSLWLRFSDLTIEN
jgi:hypothetical protein